MIVYMIRNAIFIRKSNNIVGNILNNVFMIYTAFEKKGINILQKYTVLNIKRLIYKNLILNIKKIPQDTSFFYYYIIL